MAHRRVSKRKEVGTRAALTHCGRWRTGVSARGRRWGQGRHSQSAGDGAQAHQRGEGGGDKGGTHSLRAMAHRRVSEGKEVGTRAALTNCGRWRTGVSARGRRWGQAALTSCGRWRTGVSASARRWGQGGTHVLWAMAHGHVSEGKEVGTRAALTTCGRWRTGVSARGRRWGQGRHSRAAGDGARACQRGEGGGDKGGTHDLRAMGTGVSARGRRWGQGRHSRPAGDGARACQRRRRWGQGRHSRPAGDGARACQRRRRWGQGRHSQSAGDGTRACQRGEGGGDKGDTHSLRAMAHGHVSEGKEVGTRTTLTNCGRWHTGMSARGRRWGQGQHSRTVGDGARVCQQGEGGGDKGGTHVLRAMAHGRVSEEGGGDKGGTHVLQAMAHGCVSEEGGGDKGDTHSLRAMAHGHVSEGKEVGTRAALTNCGRWRTGVSARGRRWGQGRHSRAVGDGARACQRGEGGGDKGGTHDLRLWAMAHGHVSEGKEVGTRAALTTCGRWRTGVSARGRRWGQGRHSHPAGDGARACQRGEGGGDKGGTHVLRAMAHWRVSKRKEVGTRAALTSCVRWRTGVSARGSGDKGGTHELRAMAHGRVSEGKEVGTRAALTSCGRWRTGVSASARRWGQGRHSRPAGDGAWACQRAQGGGDKGGTHVCRRWRTGVSASARRWGQGRHSRPAGDGARACQRAEGGARLKMELTYLHIGM
ncbi:hypothetical protein B0H16DRAFT_1843811 [Mycena metata]|uniref:Uncharacterized protein n=1 Tax=Mycena metata TaxID=1033252 RepID=A0AAD7GHH0_9AGAR|nr:hypothetical protein B0H16DRAFT_1843811 [Mycena metata]